MPRAAITDVLQQRESTKLDFKQDLSSMRRVLETVCSFLNTAGGTLVVGVNDEREVVGLANVEKEEEKLSNAIANSIEPQPTAVIEIVTVEGKDILVADVAYAAGPFFIKARGKEKATFVRVGANSFPAPPTKIAELERVRLAVGWDQEPMPELSRDDLDEEAMTRWFDSVDERTSDAKLRGLQVLAKYGHGLVPTRAGVILFGLDRSLHFPDAEIRCARFAGVDKSQPVGGHEMEGTVLDGIDQALDFIERSTDSLTIISGRAQHDVVSLYAPIAVREVINNAVAHTDYAVGGASIFVALYVDRLEVSSPGSWPPGFALEDFKEGASLRRNKAITRVLRRLRVVEAYGSGFDRVAAACQASGHPVPEWVENGPQIKVVFRPHPAAFSQKLVPPRSSRELTASERREAVERAIDELDRPTQAALVEATGLPRASLARLLRTLREEGVIRWEGTNRSGFYVRLDR